MKRDSHFPNSIDSTILHFVIVKISTPTCSFYLRFLALFHHARLGRLGAKAFRLTFEKIWPVNPNESWDYGITCPKTHCTPLPCFKPSGYPWWRVSVMWLNCFRPHHVRRSIPKTPWLGKRKALDIKYAQRMEEMCSMSGWLERATVKGLFWLCSAASTNILLCMFHLYLPFLSNTA